jgi:UDP:flavonoid glycosyltransferase YjiC (YdhE family)
VAQSGRNRRAELSVKLGLADSEKLVLVGMGGIRYRPPVEQWTHLPGVMFLVPDDWQTDHPATRSLSETGMVFRDALASADALITKPGYGSYVEAVTAGVPVLTIPRPDWPEAPYLNDWLMASGRALAISEEALLLGELAEPLAELWAMPMTSPLAANGATVAAKYLLALR